MVLKYLICNENQLTWNVIGNVLAASVDKFDANDVINDYDAYRKLQGKEYPKMIPEDKIYYELKHRNIRHEDNELYTKLPNFSICAVDKQYPLGVKKICAVIGNSLRNWEDNYCLQLICSNDVYLLDNNGNTVEKL